MKMSDIASNEPMCFLASAIKEYILQSSWWYVTVVELTACQYGMQSRALQVVSIAIVTLLLSNLFE